MTGSLYHFCNGCEFRKDTGKNISCPSDFNPYDDGKCQRNSKFIALEKRKRDGERRIKKVRDFKW